jgi:hypothetical protein
MLFSNTLSAKLPVKIATWFDSTVLKIGFHGTYYHRFWSHFERVNKLLLNEPKFHEDLEKLGSSCWGNSNDFGDPTNPYEALKVNRTNEGNW